MASKVDGGKGSKAPEGAEKRRMRRIKTSRQVLFSNLETTGLLRNGTAEDMSAGGLRIATQYPEQPGVEIQIELQPNPGDNEGEVVFLRGRVAHVVQLEGGNSAMGVRLLDGPGFSGGGSSRRAGSPSPMRKAYFRPRAGRLARDPSAPHDWVKGAPRTTRIRMTARDQAVGSQVRPSGSGRRARRWAAVLALLFLFALLLSGPPADSPKGHRGYGLYTPAAQAVTEEREPWPEPEAPGRDLGRSSSDETMEGTARMAWGLEDVPDAFTGVMEASLSAGWLLDYPEMFGWPPPNRSVSAIERFTALLDRAEAAAARGERGHAFAMVRKGLVLAGDIPEPWLVMGRQLMERLARPGSVSGMRAADGWAADGLGIDIDTTKYVLSLLRNGRVLLTFPVGLGQDGSTPLGEFRIANKITDPAWYNRGTVVPAGAPDNPLGRRWIGLRAGGRATRYGIHSTKEPQSIGKPLSRGCVRMRPRDAETVFRLCPIGTPVRIHS